MTPHLKIAELSVITQHKEQGDPRLLSPNRQEFVHSPMFKARGKRDLGHIFVPYVFLGDNLDPFLLCSKFRYCSSTLGAKQPEVIFFIQLYSSSYGSFQVTYKLWEQANKPNSHKLFIPKRSDSGSHAAFAELSVSKTKP